MAKRKNSSLDDFVLKYLKEKGMKKSYQMLLEKNTVDRADNQSFSKISKKFQDFLWSEKYCRRKPNQTILDLKSILIYFNQKWNIQ